MKSVYHLIFCSSLFLLAACTADKPLQSPAAPETLYSEAAADYQGVIDCKDCAGKTVQYNLQLKKDGSFMLKRQEGKQLSSKSIMGSWSMTSDSLIYLPVDSTSIDTFYYDGKLLHLKYGNSNAYKAAGSNFLKRIPGRSSSQNIQEEANLKNTADFVAGNQEWSLEIDFDENLKFSSSSSGETFTAPVSSGIEPNDLNAVIYRASQEGNSLVVTVYDKPCETEAADTSYNHSVSISFKNGDNVNDYRGCGKFNPDQRLHDIWALKSLDGEEIAADRFMKGLPTIEINLRENRISGNDGCNSFSGSLNPKGDALKIGTLSGTKMHCPDMEKSKDITTVLSNQTVQYQLKNGNLSLTGPTGKILVYKKVD